MFGVCVTGDVVFAAASTRIISCLCVMTCFLFDACIGTSLGYMAPKQDMKKDDLKGDGQSSDDLAVAAVVPTLTSATAA